MPSRAYISFLLEYRVSSKLLTRNFNALSGLYLISTVPLQKPRFYAVSRACFAGIYQNILTTAVFRAC